MAEPKVYVVYEGPSDQFDAQNLLGEQGKHLIFQPFLSAARPAGDAGGHAVALTESQLDLLRRSYPDHVFTEVPAEKLERGERMLKGPSGKVAPVGDHPDYPKAAAAAAATTKTAAETKVVDGKKH